MCVYFEFTLLFLHLVISKWFQISTSWTRKFPKHTLAPLCWEILLRGCECVCMCAAIPLTWLSIYDRVSLSARFKAVACYRSYCIPFIRAHISTVIFNSYVSSSSMSSLSSSSLLSWSLLLSLSWSLLSSSLSLLLLSLLSLLLWSSSYGSPRPYHYLYICRHTCLGE